MKPLRLSMKAFGPYADEEIVDFSKLEDNSLFLIHGQTGSGKSSLLDAICFALYGESTATDKLQPQLRSHYATDKQKTSVTLDFSLAGKSYRISRQPRQSLPGRKSEVPHEATLWDRSDATDNDQEGTVIASKAKAVDAKIESLLGFKAAQFKQVVVLPQGEFRKLLVSNSAERELILAKLFRTEHYKHLETKLKDAEKKVRKELYELTDEKQFHLNQEDVESASELREKLEIILLETKQIEKEIQLLKNREKQASKDLEVTRESNRRFDEFSEAGKKLSKIEEQQTRIEEIQNQLKQANSAKNMQDVYSLLQERMNKKQQLQTTLDKTVFHHQQAIQELEAANMQFEKAQANASNVDQLKILLSKLQGFEQQVKELDQANKVLADLAKEKQSGNKELQKLQGHIEQLKQADEGNSLKLAAVKELSLKKDTLELLYREAAKKTALKTEHIKSTREQTNISSEILDLEKKLQTADNYLQKQKQQLKTQEEIWVNGQAAILADKLEKNLACPVCGSLDHPHPARSDEKLPSKAEIKQMKDTVEQAEQNLVNLNRVLDNKSKKTAVLLSTIENMEKDFTDIAKSDFNVLKATESDLKNKQNDAMQATKQAAILEETIQQQKVQLKKLEQQNEISEKEYTRICNKHNLQTGLVNEKHSAIPEEYQHAQTLVIQINKTKEKLKNLEHALQRDKSAFEEATKTESELKYKLQTLKTQLEQSEKALAKTNKTFEERLSSQGFADITEFNTALQLVTRIESLQDEVDNFLKDKAAANERYHRAEKELQQKIHIDSAELEGKLESLKNELLESNKNQAKKTLRIKQLKSTTEQLDKLVLKIEAKEKEYALIKSVSDAASGNNPSKLPFHRFVLGSFLDEVLIHASQRLRLMSRGRYDLERSFEKESHGKTGGLGLMVSDTYTGTQRAVNTLSGGETFLASLALALGLADVVQSYSGGIQLDTMFIDEGFGTLDPESLDLAFKTLMELKNGRLVGIISHVPELKERIDVRLEVLSGKHGSRAVFHV